MERRFFVGALLVAFLSTFFISINIYYKKTVERPVKSGVYTEGVVGQPIFINPLMPTSNDVDRDLIEILFSSLDDLVENYQVNDDNKAWTLTLKKDLKWSDGEPIIADDIIFTLEAIQNPDNNHPLYATWQGVVVERLNENEVRFILKTPYVFLIDNFKEIKIAPKHIFGNIPAANLRLARFNLEPIGSGPYKFNRLSAQNNGFITEYHLAINDLYHGVKPYIEKIIFKFYQNDSDLIDAFNQRKIDGLGGLRPKFLSELKVGYQVISINMPRYYAIFFNQNTSSALQENAVRQALTLATDKSRVVKEVFDDQTIIMNGPIPPNITGYNQELYKEEVFDLAKASEILDKAGWTIGEQNIRIKKGVPLELTIIVPDIPFLIETVNLIQKDWEKIGVKLTPITLSPNDINNNVIRARDYEIIIFGNILKKNPDVFSFWHSSERFFPGKNLALYSDKQADNLLESIRQDFNNDSRNQKLAKLQEIIKSDQPAIFLFSPNYLYITIKNLRGFRSYFVNVPANRFEKINEWHLKTARIFR